MRAISGFGRGCEDGFGQSLALFESFWQIDPADGTGFFIVLPATAFEVASNDAFYGDNLAFTADHASPEEVVAPGR